MYNLYVAREPGEYLLRAGKPAKTLDRAIARARNLRAHKIEVRDDAQHYTRRLQAIFVDGVQVGV